jgi:hypothetical protein
MCPILSADRRLHAPHRVPGLGVTHELDVGSHFVPRARGQDGERDAAGVEVDGVLHVPGRGGAALALALVWRAVVPHVLVDHELVATLERVDERDRAVNAGNLDRAVELDHRQPPPGRGDRVALTGVRPFSRASSSARAACQVARSTTGGLPGRLLLALPGVVVMVPSAVSSRALAGSLGSCQLRRLTVPRLIDPRADR